ncbi:MAG: hypothetical protein GF398_19775 [Chitinivibrionales bacterium]|nr:hypothetical protein [Chitinivibrionales bacterium]
MIGSREIRSINSKYEIIMYWSNEDSILTAELPGLPGCMAHGDAQQGALKNIQQTL